MFARLVLIWFESENMKTFRQVCFTLLETHFGATSGKMMGRSAKWLFELPSSSLQSLWAFDLNGWAQMDQFPLDRVVLSNYKSTFELHNETTWNRYRLWCLRFSWSIRTHSSAAMMARDHDQTCEPRLATLIALSNRIHQTDQSNTTQIRWIVCWFSSDGKESN